jgi:lipoprotein signal peptidase
MTLPFAASFVASPAAYRPAVLSGVMRRYLTIAAMVAAADLATKALAGAALMEGQLHAWGDRLGLMLVYNMAGAGGMTFGSHTWSVNVYLTAIALALVARVVGPLAALHRGAPLALALISGGALGNLLSLLGGPAGVCDFLSLRVSSESTIVMNVADLELWAGALLLIPVAQRLVRALRQG